MTISKKRSFVQFLSVRLLVFGVIGAGVCAWVPLSSTLDRSAFLASVIGCWLGLLLIFRKRKIARRLLLALSCVILIPICLPGRDVNTVELRGRYVERLKAFEGVEYFWGGENARGIDCSGLPRRAFRDALLVYGLRHANGRTIRAALENWWFDSSAQALSEGYRNYTKPLGIEDTIQELDVSGLLPGDLAITKNGAHMLAYTGNGTWIQAEPGRGIVITLHGKNDKDGWFIQPVTLHRWQLLTSD